MCPSWNRSLRSSNFRSSGATGDDALPGRHIHVVADSAYAGGELKLPKAVTWTTGLRKDAALHDLPLRRTGKRGRPRTKGDRLPCRPPGPADGGAGQRPLAPVARARRGCPERGRGALRLLGAGRTPAGGQAGRDHPGAVERVHDLHSKGASLLACTRLGLSMNTVKRYDRATEPGRVQRVPKYRPTLAGPTATTSASAAPKSPASRPAPPARDQGARIPGQLQPPDPLHQPGPAGRQPAAPVTPPGRLAPPHQARPPGAGQQETVSRVQAACPEMTALANLIRDFAGFLTPEPGNATRLQEWITAARAADLPHAHAFYPRTEPGHPGRDSGLHRALPQRPDRGSQHQDEDDQEADVRTSGVRLLRHRILLG